MSSHEIHVLCTQITHYLPMPIFFTGNLDITLKLVANLNSEARVVLRKGTRLGSQYSQSRKNELSASN